MLKFSQKDTIQYLESKLLKKYDFITHAFCTRCGGVSEGMFANLNFSLREGDKEEEVSRNWEILASSFDVPVEQFFMARQFHNDGICVLDDNPDSILNAKQTPDFDAVVSNRPHLAIGILTADCVPILLADIKNRVIGVIHAGWKGTALSIAKKTVDTFIKHFSSRPSDIIAAIGPAIGRCCYQVDDIVFEAIRGDINRDYFFIKCSEKGKWMFDLPLANRFQIQNAGVPPENISYVNVCTSCHDDIFFSHRRDRGNTGRQLSFIFLK